MNDQIRNKVLWLANEFALEEKMRWDCESHLVLGVHIITVRGVSPFVGHPSNEVKTVCATQVPCSNCVKMLIRTT